MQDVWILEAILRHTLTDFSSSFFGAFALQCTAFNNKSKKIVRTTNFQLWNEKSSIWCNNKTSNFIAIHETRMKNENGIAVRQQKALNWDWKLADFSRCCQACKNQIWCEAREIFRMSFADYNPFGCVWASDLVICNRERLR